MMTKFSFIAFFLFNSLQAWGIGINFQVPEGDDSLYVCNVGLKHKPFVPSGCNSPNCIQRQNQNDYFEVEYESLLTGQTSKFALLGGADEFKTLFEQPSQEFKVTKLTYNLASERYGAEYYVELCYKVVGVPLVSTQVDETLWCRVQQLGNNRVRQWQVVLNGNQSFPGYAGLCQGGTSDGKVAICHVPPGNPSQARTLIVGNPSLQAHLNHGDSLGACPRYTKITTSLKAEALVQNLRFDVNANYNQLSGLGLRAEYTCNTFQGDNFVGNSGRYFPWRGTDFRGLLDQFWERPIGNHIDNCRVRYFFKEGRVGRTRINPLHGAQITTHTEIETRVFSSTGPVNGCLVGVDTNCTN